MRQPGPWQRRSSTPQSRVAGDENGRSASTTSITRGVCAVADHCATGCATRALGL